MTGSVVLEDGFAEEGSERSKFQTWRKAVFHFAETPDEQVGLRHETILKVLREQFSFLTYS